MDARADFWVAVEPEEVARVRARVSRAARKGGKGGHEDTRSCHRHEEAHVSRKKESRMLSSTTWEGFTKHDLVRDPHAASAIQKATRVLISLWDSLMFGRVPKNSTAKTAPLTQMAALTRFQDARLLVRTTHYARSFRVCTLRTRHGHDMTVVYLFVKHRHCLARVIPHLTCARRRTRASGCPDPREMAFSRPRPIVCCVGSRVRDGTGSAIQYKRVLEYLSRYGTR